MNSFGGRSLFPSTIVRRLPSPHPSRPTLPRPFPSDIISRVTTGLLRRDRGWRDRRCQRRPPLQCVPFTPPPAPQRPSRERTPHHQSPPPSVTDGRRFAKKKKSKITAISRGGPRRVINDRLLKADTSGLVVRVRRRAWACDIHEDEDVNAPICILLPFFRKRSGLLLLFSFLSLAPHVFRCKVTAALNPHHTIYVPSKVLVSVCRTVVLY